MDLTDAPAEADFRQIVKDFIAEHGDKGRGRGARGGDDDESGWSKEARAKGQSWRDALVERGWIAPAWPTAYGGAGLSVKEQFILNEELAEAGLGNVGGFGVMMLGPTLMVHGNDEQKAEILPKILAGEVVWCQGLVGAGCRVGSRLPPDARGARRRRVRAQRSEDLDHRRPARRSHVHAGAHRPGCTEAPQHLDADARHEGPRRQRAPADDDGKHSDVQRGLLRGRPRPGIEPDRARRTAAGTRA